MYFSAVPRTILLGAEFGLEHTHSHVIYREDWKSWRVASIVTISLGSLCPWGPSRRVPMLYKYLIFHIAHNLISNKQQQYLVLTWSWLWDFECMAEVSSSHVSVDDNSWINGAPVVIVFSLISPLSPEPIRGRKLAWVRKLLANLLITCTKHYFVHTLAVNIFRSCLRLDIWISEHTTPSYHNLISILKCW